MRILFGTDFHSSTLVFEKAVAAAEEFSVDLLIIGGDLSGKRIVPILKDRPSDLVALEPFKRTGAEGVPLEVWKAQKLLGSDLPSFTRRLESKGLLWKIVSSEELDRYNRDDKARRALSDELAVERILGWSKIVENRLSDDVACVWTGGNDDGPELLTALSHRDLGRFQYVEDKQFELDGFTLLSLGYSNITPFKTGRELEEPVLRTHLDRMAAGISSFERVLLNVHVPPAKCGTLDLCPDVDNPGQLKHVGSTEVRAFIEKTQPLADFAGHVHEGQGAATIGRTQVFNPGSDFSAGVLQAFVVRLSANRVEEYVHIIR